MSLTTPFANANARALRTDNTTANLLLRPRQPSAFMLAARNFGPGGVWCRGLEVSVPTWTPRQRARFAMWCAMQMATANASDRIEWMQQGLLHGVELCRTPG